MSDESKVEIKHLKAVLLNVAGSEKATGTERMRAALALAELERWWAVSESFNSNAMMSLRNIINGKAD